MVNVVKNNYRFYLYFALSLVSLLFIDFGFRFFSEAHNTLIITSRLVLFNTSLALLFSLLAYAFPMKFGKYIISILLLLYGAYAITQLGFINFMGNYMSINAAFDGAQRVTTEVSGFIGALRIETFVLILPAIISFVICIRTKNMIDSKPKLSFYLISGIFLILVHGLGISSVMLISNPHSIIQAEQLYSNPQPPELALSELGINRFMWRDVMSIFNESEDVLIIQPESTPTPTPQVTSTPETEVIHREIDDSTWISMMDSEENTSILSVDEYLISREISDYNDMTGIFEDKNFIYIMVEAFDYMAIDETLTPTLYKMKTQGISFSNFYSPKYSCTTAESEFIGLNSLVPSSSVCTPNTYKNNAYPHAIFNLFNDQQYISTSYHNWNDQFYDRNTYHLNMGSSRYLDIDALGLPIIQGWQSDATMMEAITPLFVEDEPFFSFIITSSTHFPYDESSTLGNRYLEEVGAVYPDLKINLQRYVSKAIELDKAMEILLAALEEQGILEDTVIAMYSDHHPLKTSYSDIASFNQEVDRLEGLNIDRTPFFIYNSEVTPQVVDTLASTYDLVPTIANMFNLEYDPRYYVGSDVFDDVEPLVILNNGDWISEEGIFYASSSSFEPFDEALSIDSNWLQQQNAKVSNLFNISLEIYESDYFAHREFDVTYK